MVFQIPYSVSFSILSSLSYESVLDWNFYVWWLELDLTGDDTSDLNIPHEMDLLLHPLSTFPREPIGIVWSKVCRVLDVNEIVGNLYRDFPVILYWYV